MLPNPKNTTAGGAPARSPAAAAFASIMGWAFDLFDLFILLYVAGPVGHKIFPAESETLSLALVFASFAVSVVMRPGGAALFGELADRLGRKRIMVPVLMGVGIATAAMGLVPSYETAGLLAPVLFIGLRVIQGLFVGGVTAVTHTLGTESVAPRWRGLMSGMIGAGGAGLGAAMASVAFIVVSSFYPGDAFNETGWRVMFFMGLLGSALSLFVLRKVDESPLWLEAHQTKIKSSAPAKRIRFGDLIAGRYRKLTALNILIAAGAGGGYYLTSGFLPTALGQVMGVDIDVRGGILLVASMGVVVAAAVGGELSQRIGRKKAMLTFGCLNLVALPGLTLLLVSLDPTSTAAITTVAVVITFMANAAYAPLMIFLNERYPTELRSRGTAVSWNTGFMLGGLLPTLVNLLSPEVSDIPLRLVACIGAAAAVFVVSVLLSPETRGTLDVNSPQGEASPLGVKGAE